MLWSLIKCILYGAVSFIYLSYSKLTNLYHLVALSVTLRLLSISGAIDSAVSTSKEQDQQKSENKSNSNTCPSQSKGNRVNQKPKKINDVPTFNTSLETPIEDIIEETINEEVKSNKRKGKISKHSAKTGKSSKKGVGKQEPVDDIGYSFFNINTVNKVSSENKTKKSTRVDLIEKNQTDEVGFSFLSIKEKGKKYKVQSSSKNEARVDGTTKKIESSKYIGDGSQKRKSSESLLLKRDLRTEKSQSPVSSTIPTVAENRLIYETLLKNKYKESKKVTSAVSYASIVTNSVTDASLKYEPQSNDALSSSYVKVVDECYIEEPINFQQEVKTESDVVQIKDSDTSKNAYIYNKELQIHEEPTSGTFDQESENSESDLISSSTLDFFVISEENKSQVYASVEEDNSIETSTFVLDSYQDNSHNNYNYVTAPDYLLETNIGDCSAYSFEETHIQHKKSFNISDISDLSRPLSSDEHSFTDLVGSNNIADTFSTDATSTHFYQSANAGLEQFEATTENPVLNSDYVHEDLFQRFDLVPDNTFENVSGHLDHIREEKKLFIDGKESSQITEEYQAVTNCVVAEEPFVKHNAYTVSSESEKFIREEINFTQTNWPVNNCKEKIVVGDQLALLKVASHIPELLDQNISEETVLSIDDRNLDIKETEQIREILHKDRTDNIDNVHQNQPTKEELEQDFVHIVNTDYTEKFKQEEKQAKDYLEEESKVQDFVYVITDNNEQTLTNEKIIIEQAPLPEKSSLLQEKNSFKQQPQKENIILTTNSNSDFIKSEKQAFADFPNKTEQQLNHKSEIEVSNIVIFENMQQTRVLTLNDHEHQESTLYRIEKNWIIQFRIGPSLFGRNVFLYCNYPSKPNNQLNEFKRNKYQTLEWTTNEGCENADDTALFAEIKVELSGSFHYYFTYEKGETVERQGSGYFLVDPVLKYGNEEDLPLDCIQCQTVLAKCLGSFSSWEKKLQVSKESGYNMIHFTPIQELGESNSSYSLSDQLKLNPIFKKADGKMPTFEEIEKFIAKLRNEWKVTSICDIVLNHTANESKWIQEHPDVTYNCVNCPYMRPAYLLDAALDFFSSEIKKGLYEDRGIPSDINNEDHLNAIRHHFKANILDTLKLNELFICDTNKLVDEFLILARSNQPNSSKCESEGNDLKLIQDPEYKRLASTVDMEQALKLYNHFWNDTFDEDSRLKKCAEKFKNKLDELNNEKSNEINEHLNVAIENVVAGIRYYRVQHDGPKFKDITVKTPLVYRYFTDYGHPKSLKEFEEIMYSDKGRFLMAHNGWVINSDPLKNFAASDSKVYLRRELIAWGDSVKLRYGEKLEDSPFLWNHMRKYVEQTARIFDGIRLDNCHSTPIPLAEYLLDCARRIRPNLYVAAELFTNSDMTDNIFVNRLGITSLIREAMSAWDSHEEGRLVYRYGGSPVGSFYQLNIRPLVPSVAHALFLDQTHDNPSPIEKRSVFDLLPSTALVNMACCASGSNRGYDELVPHHIHVVEEDREYTEWTAEGSLSVDNLRFVTEESGIIKTKKAINDLHFLLGKKGFSQVYVDQMDTDIVAVTRHCPVTHQSYILVAFTAFGHPNEDAGNYQRKIKPLRFEGVLEEIVIEATLSHINHKSGGSKFAKWEKFVKDSKWIHGLSEYQVSVKQHIQITESEIFEEVDSGAPNVTELNFKNFKPGSIVVVRSSLPETMSIAVKSVRNLIKSISLGEETELLEIIGKLTLADMNRTLYRCDQEERDEGFGFGTYNIPNFGSTVYSGLQGFISLLANIRPDNDLGHPMCANLRDGNWMIDYIWKRLKLDEGTKELGEWLERNTKSFANIPRYLVPRYFDMIVTNVHLALLEKSYELMSNFVKNGSTFVKGLALGSIQFGGYIESAKLPTLSPNLVPPKPPTRKHGNETVQACVTLSAGLPHFSVGYMRNWGRDTFIALRGLFILTGRYQEAREHILGYAACMRHGLIPNLLEGGRNSRFNCRDAIWWWLYCIKEYVHEAPDGIKILSDKVSRIFPTDDVQGQPPGAVDQPLHDVIQESLKVHFQGLAFRERNAGRQIDEHMTDQGFNNQIGVHPETGFVFGGNKWNCGTWMDKMGSSDRAGNRGKPATPRDGSAVELIGLSKCVLSWLAKLYEENKYPYEGVQRVHKNGNITNWTFKDWANKIQNNFEKYFWVHSRPTDNELRPDLINKRGIYKDSYGSSAEYTDFQLRCNFPIAMVAAPELFTPSRAWEALKQTEKYLLGPLGMKTLDPEDWAYRGDYDNSNQSDDPTVAHGFNYHQGPEWVWPLGFFLRAKLIFAIKNGTLKETVASTKLILSKHFVELQTSDWRGLPELTNNNGAYCRDSSRTQAWSMSSILEVLHDLKKYESNLDLLSN